LKRAELLEDLPKNLHPPTVETEEFMTENSVDEPTTESTKELKTLEGNSKNLLLEL